jgi:hypothetical protein
MGERSTSIRRETRRLAAPMSKGNSNQWARFVRIASDRKSSRVAIVLHAKFFRTFVDCRSVQDRRLHEVGT